MKIKILLSAAILLSFSLVCFAQTVKIAPKKTIYKRNATGVPDFKKTFTVIYPKVSGLRAALNKKIENTIGYERVFNIKIKEEISEIFWLESAEFTTEYNRNGILGVALSINGSGAYPSTYTKHIVVDTKIGLQVRPEDIFTSGKIGELIKMLDNNLRKRKELAIAEIKNDNPEDGAMLAEMLSEHKFTAENLGHFSVGDKGVTFHYNYEFAHIARALEPNGDFFISYADLKPFIKPGGLLARFVG